MPRINILNEDVSSLIAAGEVVERPSSVIKELIENSIDSGADKITVEIENGGICFMRVSDNGCGIEKDDVPKAFLRHATSKVKVKSDLDAIFTMGFRGEALASICSVSKLTLMTKTKADTVGTKYQIEGAREVLFDDIGCSDGTTIIVENLFYNVPVRMKFLKKDVSEGNSVANIIDKLALSHPEISFSFIRDSKEVLNTPGNGLIKSAVYAVYGKNFTQDLVEVNYSLNGIIVNGFICKPFKARPNRSMQNFFVNSRYIKSQLISVAVEKAYKGSVLTGKFPSAVLYINISSEKIDINVHPTKTEVRFMNENQIFECIYYAVKSALAKDKSKEELKFEQNVAEKVKSDTYKEKQNEHTEINKNEVNQSQNIKSDISVINSLNNSDEEPELFIPAKKKCFQQESIPKKLRFSDTAVRTVERPLIVDKTELFKDKNKSSVLLEETIKQMQEEIIPNNQQIITEIKKENDECCHFVGEVFSTYILLEKNDEILLVDKHAAHERLIYEKLKANKEGEFLQLLLEPVKVTLEKEEYGVVLSNKELFDKAGFEIDDFGNGVILVRTIPLIFESADVEEIFLGAVQSLLLSDKKLYSSSLDNLYHSMACKSAIKANDINSDEELISLALRVQSNDNIDYCPHGRPITIVLKKKEIEKKFKRI